MYTDNNPLTYVLSTAKLDATGHRWLAALAAYNLEIKYRPGEANVNADILSRLPNEPHSGDSNPCIIDNEMVAAIRDGMIASPLVETLCLANIAETMDNLDNDPRSSIQETRHRQREDQDIGRMLKMKLNGETPDLKKLMPGTHLFQLAKEFPKFKLRRGLLYRVTTADDEDRWQVVLPTAL